jgi:hypothetical protein
VRSKPVSAVNQPKQLRVLRSATHVGSSCRIYKYERFDVTDKRLHCQTAAVRISRNFEESADCLTLQATTSDSIQDAQAIQKIRAKIGPAENGKGRNCMLF